ncbi:MAG: aminotransferase class III-fold pyridoxal phosphate-dependent enzyme [Candidatus Hatepunaea meridiana]|nr:aminotransferase class III-fold pyridoxal phosphate-dependent enzyme [Candidatus Hatepunaea meridiana]
MNNANYSQTKCHNLQVKAKDLIPGISQLLSKQPSRFSEGVWPCYFSRAKGVEIWDLDGNKYIDMSIGGIGATVLGYADPDVDAAVREAIDHGVSSSLNCPEDVELAELLCELHPWAEKIRYARTGGEAMAVSVRIARAYTGRDIVAFCGYHGWHDWYLAANLDKPNALENYLMPGDLHNGVPKGLKGSSIPFDFRDLSTLKRIVDQHKDDLAAIILEPIQNIKPDQDSLDILSDLAERTGAIVIMDEISAGFRLNTGGAHLTMGLNPDIAVFSKALGNGYPMAAIIGKGNVMSAVEKTFISSTNWTERIGPTAAIATIKKHRKTNAGEHLIHIGDIVRKGLKQVAAKHGIGIDIHGIPPMTHFTLDVPDFNSVQAYFVQLMLEQGFLASNLFYSMYAHKEKHVRSYLEVADNAFSEIADALSKRDIRNRIVGKPTLAGLRRVN